MDEPTNSNPYQPPESAPVLLVAERRFVCPKCDTALPFTRLWLMQPMGRCPICRTRLVVRRRGLHKLWTPVLMVGFGVACFVSTAVFGAVTILFIPFLLVVVAGVDGMIAYRLGYLDFPRWIF